MYDDGYRNDEMYDDGYRDDERAYHDDDDWTEFIEQGLDWEMEQQELAERSEEREFRALFGPKSTERNDDRPLTELELQAVYDRAKDLAFSVSPEEARLSRYTTRAIEELRLLRILATKLAPGRQLCWKNGKWVTRDDF